MQNPWSFHGSNPIEICAFALEYNNALSPRDIEQIASLHDNLKRELPRKLIHQSVMVNIGQPQFSSAPAQSSGVTFDLIRTDGSIDKALSAVGNTISFVTYSYTRWNEFWPLAERLISSINSIVHNNNFVTAIILSVTDRFFLNANTLAASMNLLLKADSKYIAKNMVECANHSHSFHGFMKYQEVPLPGQVIENLQLATSGTLGQDFKLDIVFNHRYVIEHNHASASKVFESSQPEQHSLVRQIVQELHANNKSLLMDILSANLLSQIPGFENVS